MKLSITSRILVWRCLRRRKEMLCWFSRDYSIMIHDQGTGRMTADADRMRLIEAIDPARCWKSM